MNIFIFSRPVRTGKTTELKNWCDTKQSVAGILMPDIDGVRYMYDIATNNLWQAECIDIHPAEELIHAGRFTFYSSAFKKAHTVIKKASIENYDWLVIDEIGKLELGEQGFYPALHDVLNTGNATNLLLVVRESLLAQILSSFPIAVYSVTNSLSEL